MVTEKKYLVTTLYGDGSRGRKVMTWAEIQAMREPINRGLSITIEEPVTNHIENAKLEVRAAFESGEVPPHDTRERALWRADFAIDLMYDRSPYEVDQPLRDILTDLLHWAGANNVDFDHAVERAKWMRDQELEEWGLAL